MQQDYEQVIKARVMDVRQFVMAVFSGRRRGYDVPWQKVNLRPLIIREQPHIQISYFDGRQDTSKNYPLDDIEAQLDTLLSDGFSNIHVRTVSGDLQVRITKKGKVMIHEQPGQYQQPMLSHDRRKHQPLPAGEPNPFLQAVGIMTPAGKVKARMQAKFRQINAFLRLIQETGELERAETLSVVDCGCGNAYLTYAAHYYLNDVLGVPTQTVGVDVREELVRNHAETATQHGWHGMAFEVSRILDFQPPAAPDMVLALHACDTATDEALAQAVAWESHLIFSAPCCHHHLQQQLSQQQVSPFEGVMRHGILRERMGDILTDALRALILRIMGYQTQVFEFISTEHTARNLMIRAVRSVSPGDRQFVEEYLALKSFWGVTPYLEELLGSALTAYL